VHPCLARLLSLGQLLVGPPEQVVTLRQVGLVHLLVVPYLWLVEVVGQRVETRAVLAVVDLPAETWLVEVVDLPEEILVAVVGQVVG
jgi:hypothetical protein